MSGIRTLGVEHSRSGTGCWASFTYREGEWTFRLSAGEPEVDGTDDLTVETEPPNRPVPLGVLARALDALEQFTCLDLAYRSGSEPCPHRFDAGLIGGGDA
jgi:hypothetical protein